MKTFLIIRNTMGKILLAIVLLTASACSQTYEIPLTNAEITSALQEVVSGVSRSGVSLTYAELVTKINANGLYKGLRYIITDFATKHFYLNGNATIDTAINTGITEPLIVTASSGNELDKQAYSALYPNDLIYYDWNPANWTSDISFSSGGSIITGWKGVIYFRQDTKKNVSANYDWRNVRLRRWQLNPNLWSGGTTYDSLDVVKGSDGKVYYSIDNGNLNHNPTTANELYWRCIIDYDISTTGFGTAGGGYLSYTETSLDIQMYIDSALTTIAIPCSTTYHNFLTFGDAALTAANKDIIIGSRKENSIVNNILLNVTARDYTFSSVKFEGLVFNSTIQSNTMYYHYYGRYFYDNLLLSNLSYFDDMQVTQGGFFHITGVNLSKNIFSVDFAINILRSGFASNNTATRVEGNYFGTNFVGNTIKHEHWANVWGDNTKYNTFSELCRYNYFPLTSFQFSKIGAFSERNIGRLSGTQLIYDVIFGSRNSDNIYKTAFIENVQWSSLSSNVTYKDTTVFRYATFLEGWNLNVETAIDLSIPAVTLLYQQYVTKTIVSNLNGSNPKILLLYKDLNSFDKTIDLLTNNTVSTYFNTLNQYLITTSTPSFVSLNLTGAGTNAGYLNISSAGTGYTHADLRLNSTSTARGTGLYNFNSSSQVTYYYGNPYGTWDQFVINRMGSTATINLAAANLSQSGVVNFLKFDNTGVMTIPVGSIISDSLITKKEKSYLADDGIITFATGVAGWGEVMAGDNQEWASFRFTSAGVVTIIQQTVNVAFLDVDGNLCIYDLGSGIGIKNRLGTGLKIAYNINYYTP